MGFALAHPNLRGLTYGNGLEESLEHGHDYRLTGQTLGTLRDLSYGYDALGNLISVTDSLQPTWQLTYDYDALLRLVSEQNTQDARQYDYDALGNRIQFTRTWTTHDGDTETWSAVLQYAADSNRLQRIGEEAEQRFDAAGNTLVARDGSAVYDYNDSGRLVRAKDNGAVVASYAYDGLGRRIKKTAYDSNAQALTYYYSYDTAGHLISEAYVAPAGYLARQTDWVWLGERPVAQLTTNLQPDGSVAQRETLYLHVDHLNTPRLATDATQTVRWRWDSDAFGWLTAERDPDGDGTGTAMRLRFPGQYYDDETGLHYNYFRDYDPATGRYIESDPIGLEGGLNTYLYAEANPLRFTDPTGEASAAGGAIAAIGYAAYRICRKIPACKKKLADLMKEAAEFCKSVHCEVRFDRKGHPFKGLDGKKVLCMHWQIDCYIKGKPGSGFSIHSRLPGCWKPGQPFPRERPPRKLP